MKHLSITAMNTDIEHYRTTDTDTQSWVYRGIVHLLALPRIVKQSILMSVDYLISVICLFYALSLRYGYVDYHIDFLMLLLFALPPIIGLYIIGFYRGAARIFSDTIMRNVLQLFVVLIIVYEVIHSFELLSGLPRSVPILYLFLFFVWLWGGRSSIRSILEHSKGGKKSSNKNVNNRENIIIYGAGAAGVELFEGLRESHKYNVVAFIDDNTQLTGAYILGKRIYAASDLVDMIDKLDVAQIFIAVPSISRANKKAIINKLADISIKIKELPSLLELADEKVTVSNMRKIDILDVLDRQTVEPDNNLLQKNIKGKCVLVTGAGGSIGSELCRQIIKNSPKCLVLYELSEYALYNIHQELIVKQASNDAYHSIEIIAKIGNVTNEDNLLRIFNDNKVQTIYHAAAYKHVPIVENNPFEGAINNSKGTYHCARAAVRAGVETFVLISTDKAVRPTNVMGASKRLAELVCQGLSQEVKNTDYTDTSDTTTCISMVRFGNVLGSSGSVVPLFTKQIEQGRAITVTHPDVTRYFMTIPEAANLVIQAGAMAHGGEVFVLDMGPPVKIVDLARRMIYLSGYNIKDDRHPDGDVEVIFTGLRAGEKLYEELIIGDDNIESTDHPLIMQAIEHSFPLSDIENVLSELDFKSKAHDVDWLKAQFKHFVAGYNERTTLK